MPRSNKEISQLGEDVMMDFIEILGILQGTCIYGTIRVTSRVSSNYREQRKLPPKMVCWPTLPKCLVSNRGFARTGLASQPEHIAVTSERTLAHSVMSCSEYLDTSSMHSSRFKTCSPRTVLQSALWEGRKSSKSSFCSSNQCCNVDHKFCTYDVVLHREYSVAHKY